jgi:hypothetical protein
MPRRHSAEDRYPDTVAGKEKNERDPGGELARTERPYPQARWVALPSALSPAIARVLCCVFTAAFRCGVHTAVTDRATACRPVTACEAERTNQ